LAQNQDNVFQGRGKTCLPEDYCFSELAL